MSEFQYLLVDLLTWASIIIGLRFVWVVAQISIEYFKGE